MTLDLDHVRRRFPAFSRPHLAGWAFLENAGGSYPCHHTVEALHRFYLDTKVQPYGPYPASQQAGQAMDRSRRRWAEALGVAVEEIQFGPSTSMNTYVLAAAFRSVLGSSDRVIVTNQDHEANTGAIRRAGAEAGAELVEWRVDPVTGLLDLDRLADLLTPTTRVVTLPHCSNIVGMENDISTVCRLAHDVGARVVVDGVSLAPHGLPDVAAMGADVYLFSLYKVYSVHQGVMVTANGLLDELPNQGHFFNQSQPAKRLTPAGPDHAQEAAAGAVLDYIEESHRHHGGSGDDGLSTAVAAMSSRWRDHERALLAPVLEWLSRSSKVRLLGPDSVDHGQLHRCPTVAFVPREQDPQEVAQALAKHQIMAGSGHFYAYRVLQGLDVDPDRGVVRLSWVHYTTADEIDRLLGVLDAVVGR